MVRAFKKECCVRNAPTCYPFLKKHLNIRNFVFLSTHVISLNIFVRISF